MKRANCHCPLMKAPKNNPEFPVCASPDQKAQIEMINVIKMFHVPPPSRFQLNFIFGTLFYLSVSDRFWFFGDLMWIWMGSNRQFRFPNGLFRKSKRMCRTCSVWTVCSRQNGHREIKTTEDKTIFTANRLEIMLYFLFRPSLRVYVTNNAIIQYTWNV